MINQEITDYVEYQIEKSKETLQDAELLYVNNKLTSAVNRIYYAMFYSVSAFANIHRFSTSKHTGIKSYFDGEIANKNLVGLEMKKFYGIIYDKRHTGDYKRYDFNKNEVGEWIIKAKDFVAKINNMTLKIINNENLQHSHSSKNQKLDAFSEDLTNMSNKNKIK